MNKNAKTLIAQPDFERISQTILGILTAENANITASCLYFGVMGAAIMQRHYGHRAIAVVGQAAYNLTGRQVISFADTPKPSTEAGRQTNFHCWVEADGWALDFSSIVFPEMLKKAGMPAGPRLMMQKPKAQAAPTLSETYRQMGFYLLANKPLTQEIIGGFKSRQANVDLVEIAVEWYQKPPEKMHEISLIDQHGNTKPAVVSALKLDGA